MKAARLRKWTPVRSRCFAHIVRARSYLVLLLALSLLQLSAAAFTCSGGPSSCPDNNLQVCMCFLRDNMQLPRAMA